MNELKLQRHDENSNTSTSTDANMAKFLALLKLDEPNGVKINSVKCTNIIYQNTSTECTQFDVNVTLAIYFNVDIKIIIPRANGLDVSKLRINVIDADIKREIISCTNYLQRQRNISLALTILKRCAALITERQLIANMLALHSEGAIKHTSDDEDGGLMITCQHKRTGFKFFESLWKVQFDCCNHIVMDFIDFSVTTRDTVFHDTVKPAMNALIIPNLPYWEKVQKWSLIVDALNASLKNKAFTSIHPGSRDYLHVRSIQEMSSPSDVQLIESDDDEDCVVIDD